MQQSGRIQSIDFWRGVVLLVIFVDHLPANPLGGWTPRNFGFSDATEAFVFLSGLVLAYVRWGSVANGRLGEVVRRCFKRAGELYLVQVSLSLAAVAIFAAAFLAGGGEAMLSDANRAAFFEHPNRGLIGLALMTYQFGFFNILSVYVVIMLMAAGMFLLLARNVLLALGASVAIYIAARLGWLGLPSWPVPHTWFLNPFAWQLLFTLGMLTGASMRRGPVPYSRPLFIGAVGCIVFAAMVVTAGFGFLPDMPGKVWPYLDTDKGILGSARLLHFLSVAYVVSQIRLGDLLLKVPGSGLVATVGRQSLSMFAAGSILSAIGQAVIVFLRTPAEMNTPFDLAGVALVVIGGATLIALAYYLTWRQKRRGPIPTRSAAVLATVLHWARSSPARSFAMVFCVGAIATSLSVDLPPTGPVLTVNSYEGRSSETMDIPGDDVLEPGPDEEAVSSVSPLEPEVEEQASIVDSNATDDGVLQDDEQDAL